MAAKSTVLDTLATLAGRATTAEGAFEQAQSQLPQISRKLDESISVAETWVIASLGFQALAAGAAIGMFIYTVKNYNKRYGHGRAVSLNSRRKRRKR
jgi:hypothetical protein